MDPQIAAAICSYLREIPSAKSDSAHPFNSVVDIISSACDISNISPPIFSLDQIYYEGVKALEKNSGSSPTLAPSEKNPTLFAKFLKQLEKTNFFKGVEKDTPEFERRLEKARKKFDTSYGGAKEHPAMVNPTSTPLSVPVASESAPNTTTPAQNSRGPELVSIKSTAATDVIQTHKAADNEPASTSQVSAISPEAEREKTLGNKAMQENKYMDAMRHYDKAISLDPNNPVYYSNRAAAKIHIEKYTSALEDCQKALSLNPRFVRAYERLASAYRHMGLRQEEQEAIENGLKIEPNNERLKSDLANLRGSINNTYSSGFPRPGATVRNMPGMSFPANATTNGGMGSNQDPMGVLNNLFGQIGDGTGGGGNGLQQLLNNPLIQNMAQNFMQSGGMDNLMNNPDLARMMQSFGGMSPPGARVDNAETLNDVPANSGNIDSQSSATQGENPLASMLDNPAFSEMMNNPRMAEIAREVQTNPMAALQYMNDPEVMRLITQMTGSLFGGTQPPI